MTRRELDAAGIHDRALRSAYLRCRQLNAEHGRTYFLATRLLGPRQRPAIHALYGFARWIDDIVDEPERGADTDVRVAELERWDGAVREGLRTGHSEHPVIAALVDTAERYGIEHRHFIDFMSSMRQDLSITDYPDRSALNTYMYGSAEVIGLQVLPVLGTTGPLAEAAGHAAALGSAFQLTNFLRDVGEDLERGRVYLPADELAAFGVDRDRLAWCQHAGRPDRAVRRALADQVARTKAVYREAAPGINMLDPISRPCVSTAYTLYGEILDRIVESGYEVFGRRVGVARSRRLGVVLGTVAGVADARVRSRLVGSSVHETFLSRLGGGNR